MILCESACNKPESYERGIPLKIAALAAWCQEILMCLPFVHVRLDAFVMAAGTGGTIAGAGAYLRRMDPSIEVCLVDPPGSALYHRVRNLQCIY